MGTDLKPLDVSHIYAGYGKREVLQDISFTVEGGEIFGIIGLNGAGKTTLIKTALGLRDSLKGQISVFGHAAGSNDAKRQIAYLPEKFDPPFFLTGDKFIEFSTAFYGVSVSLEQKQALAESLSLNPDVLKNSIRTYSKGMRQKLGLMATVLTGCPLLLLDEPMSGLDPLARVLVKDMLYKVRAEGRTVVLSSHILADMDEMCERVTIIHDGVIHFTGKTQDFKARSGEQTLERAFLETVNIRKAA